MCYQIVERCPFCHLVSHEHAIDACLSYGKSGHAVQEKTVFTSDACPEHYNHGIQEAGDAVQFPSNSALRSAGTETDRNDAGLDVGKQAASVESESASMATPRAIMSKAIDHSRLESPKPALPYERKDAQDTTPAYGHGFSDDLSDIPRHKSSDATQYSTDSASSRHGSCSTAATSRSSSLAPISRTDSLEGDFEMDSFTDYSITEGSIRPVTITPQRLLDLLNIPDQRILLLDMRVSAQYTLRRILGAFNVRIPTGPARRPFYDVDMLTDIFSSSQGDERDEFAEWKMCNCIVFYGANSLNMEDAAYAVAILEQLKPKDGDSLYYILRGGFSEFSKLFPELVEPLSTTKYFGGRYRNRAQAALQNLKKQNASNIKGSPCDAASGASLYTLSPKLEDQPPLQRHGAATERKQNDVTEALRNHASNKSETDMTSSAAGPQESGRSTRYQLQDGNDNKANSADLPDMLKRSALIDLPQQQNTTIAAVEPEDSGYESSLDARSQQMCPEFEAIAEGHWSLETWRALQPIIREQYRYIMGFRNSGAIELLAKNGRSTVCVTCRTPWRVKQNLLRSVVAPLPIYVGQGRVRRSMHARSGFDMHSSDDAWDEDDWPSSNGQYAQKPVCGASIGVTDNNALETHAVSLGGYIQIKPQNCHEWHWYGLTCHHLLEMDDGDVTDLEGSETQTYESYTDIVESSAMSPVHQSSVQSPSGSWIPSAQSTLQSPAKTTIANLIFRLEERLSYKQKYDDYAELDDMDLHYDISRLKDSEKGFGRAEFSSGLCIDTKFNVQMDWLLIGNIPLHRLGSNYVGSLLNYKEGFRCPTTSPTANSGQYIELKQFGTLIMSCRERKKDHGNRCGLFSRIHGIGSETGVGEGRLVSHQVGIDLDGTGNPTFEWSFKPRCKLGTSGDSGTWIFTENGKLLGMIWGFNDLTGMVYYTPIYMLFDHFKRALKLQDIQVPEIQHLIPNDSGYGSPPSSRGISELNLNA